MSEAFEKTLNQAKSLSKQEQLALIAELSQVLADSGKSDFEEGGVLSEEEEAELLRRIAAYEADKSQTISGSEFREILRRKYQV